MSEAMKVVIVLGVSALLGALLYMTLARSGAGFDRLTASCERRGGVLVWVDRDNDGRQWCIRREAVIEP